MLRLRPPYPNPVPREKRGNRVPDSATANAVCQKCAELSGRFSDLSEQLARSTDRLTNLARAAQFAEFDNTKISAREVRWRCNQAGAELQEHRAEHGS